MSADNTWSLLGSNFGIISTIVLGNEGPAPSTSDVTLFCQFQLKGCHLPRRATQAIPVRSIPYIVQWLSRPTFASHNPILAPILRNQPYSPMCAVGFLHLRPDLLISLVFIFTDSHFVDDLSCKTEKPAEQWAAICDANACVLFS